MAVQLESAARLAALRDKADAVTGESSATLAGAVDALIAGFGAGGGGAGGGSMESGEIIGASQSKNVIPVSSKKTHILMYSKIIENPEENTGRISYLVCVEGKFRWERRCAENSYFYANSDSVTFEDTAITLALSGVPFNATDFYWFAW